MQKNAGFSLFEELGKTRRDRQKRERYRRAGIAPVFVCALNPVSLAP